MKIIRNPDWIGIIEYENRISVVHLQHGKVPLKTDRPRASARHTLRLGEAAILLRFVENLVFMDDYYGALYVYMHKSDEFVISPTVLVKSLSGSFLFS